MGMIEAIAFAILALAGAIGSKVIDEDIRAWIPWLTNRLIVYAVAQLPPDQCERYEEEWRAHLNEVPGTIGKVIVAIGFLHASRVLLRVPTESVDFEEPTMEEILAAVRRIVAEDQALASSEICRLCDFKGVCPSCGGALTPVQKE
jgi:hypothetical protein